MSAGPQCSTLVLGPPRSGKTSSLVIPNILLADGPVLSTSTKPDVMRATAPSRCREGWSFLYDPSGEVECPPASSASVGRRSRARPIGTRRWSPRMQWSGASRSSGQRASEHHWTERAGALLSTLLHAAAMEKLSMRDVLKWIDRHMGPQPSKFSPPTPEATLLQPISSPGSSPQIPVSSQVSGPPHLASWPRTGRRCACVHPRRPIGSRGLLWRGQHALRLLNWAPAAPIRPTRRRDRRGRARRRLRPIPRRTSRPAHASGA